MWKFKQTVCVLTNNFCQLPPAFTENYAVQTLMAKVASQGYERRQRCQVFHMRSTESFSIDCASIWIWHIFVSTPFRIL